MDRMLERAAVWGIETEYWDGCGRLRVVEPAALSRLLGALEREPEFGQRMLPRVVVIRAGHDRSLQLAAAEGLPLRWEIFSQQKIAEGKATSPVLTIPPELPVGTFRLRVTVADSAAQRSEEAPLVVSYDRAYQGDAAAPRRMWALAVQLYGIRSARNWGQGDFTDLLALIDLAADLGASAVGLNPLHALFDDRPSAPSPYFRSSRLFLNPLYIDLAAVPEFPGLRAAGLEERVGYLRSTDMVDYAAVVAAKVRALRLAYANFREVGIPDRHDAFDRFRHARGS